jgi:hypothetical protein
MERMGKIEGSHTGKTEKVQCTENSGRKHDGIIEQNLGEIKP